GGGRPGRAAAPGRTASAVNGHRLTLLPHREHPCRPAREAPRVRGLRHPLLRFLAEPPRERARASVEPSRGLLRRDRRALAVLLPRRRDGRILIGARFGATAPRRAPSNCGPSSPGPPPPRTSSARTRGGPRPG